MHRGPEMRAVILAAVAMLANCAEQATESEASPPAAAADEHHHDYCIVGAGRVFCSSQAFQRSPLALRVRLCRGAAVAEDGARAG